MYGLSGAWTLRTGSLALCLFGIGHGIAAVLAHLLLLLAAALLFGRVFTVLQVARVFGLNGYLAAHQYRDGFVVHHAQHCLK